MISQTEWARILRYSGYKSLVDFYERCSPHLRLMPDGTWRELSFNELFDTDADRPLVQMGFNFDYGDAA